MVEIFKDIPGYEGMYQVSNLGRVKSLKRKYRLKEIVLKIIINNHGYSVVNLSKNNIMKICRVHQLVTLTFLGHTPNGNVLVIDHINNIKNDNRLCNLQVITNRENSSKDKKGGTSKCVGVHFKKESNKWVSRIAINGKRKHLGDFVNEYDAHLAYQKELKKL